MAKNEMNSGVENSSEANGEAKEKRVPVEIKFYDSLDEAKANRPAGADAKNKNGEYVWKVFKVTRPNDGADVFLWSVGSHAALHNVAREDGYTVGSGEGRGPRQSSGVPFAALAALDDSVLASLGLEPATLEKIKAARKHDAENAQASKATQAAHQQNVKKGTARRLAQ